ncbi:MAG: bifunctional (p)ppGpp synthetase/guanosine-3',5'-bis(diphosphate) 3'-pyrophosphohydrolase [Anaerolineae bacterium]|nr:bifunctional (p)ppGpp synthetase/guanosine-3',5'-bis(diphosphate) 3'-pyrophosphohydrolase [Anaerolineae bacterium]
MISSEKLAPWLENLIERLPESYSVADREMITHAYKYAENAHEGQKRASGEPYITHCVAVAIILAEMQVQPIVVSAALLHDTVEDTNVTLDDIRKGFGPEIGGLVDGVTKLTHLPRVSRADQHVSEIFDQITEDSEEDDSLHDSQLARDRRHDLANETLRKTFLAMGEDIRVILIKLADRLHNMRTLGFMPEKKRKRIAQETLDIFAPLANRLGIWQLKWELEDLGFRYTNPEKYKEIAQNLSETRLERDRQMQAISDKINKLLTDAGVKVEISARSKHIFSIYKKMQEKNKPFELVRDLRGVRLIVQDIPACYSALGLIHTNWRPIPNEFDDYIAGPKDNFYQSLHTAILYDDGKPLEVQIRTSEMDENAEFGIAAHWKYKEKGPHDEKYEQRINWLKKLMEWRQDVEDANEFVDGMKTDVFQDRVYVFTPRGDIIDLPSGSTPIDFAYHVHTEIGNRCRGAKINGKLVNLEYTLKTGDQVEILVAKQGGPSRDWLNVNLGLVKTQRARSKIRAWFKHQNRDQNLSQGKDILEKELRRLGLVDYNVEKFANNFDFRSMDDLYVAVGCGDISIGHLVNLLSEGERVQPDFLLPRPVAPQRQISDTAVSVLGLKNILVTYGKCCKPVPGDEIIGYITRGRGATIHRQDCPNILRMTDHDRIVRVTWGEPQLTFPVEIQIKAYDRQGLMGDISSLLTNENINLSDIKLNVLHNLAHMVLKLEISDIAQLSRVLTKIENLPNVMEAHRLKPG